MIMKKITHLFVLLFLFFQLHVVLVPQKLFAANLDNITIEIENVTSGMSLPISIKNAGDGSGNLFIVEQGGRVLIYDGTQLLPDAFLDISSIVRCCEERGLLDIEFHPDYVNNGFFYVHYSDLSGDTVIARYSRSADPLLADPNSSTIILTQNQPATNHNGGQMQFGPDGFLYIALGDGGSSGPAQDLNQLLGKILRIDIDSGLPYTIPADNPFVGVAGTQPEIWAYGLRNPWRMSFDRQTGDLLIADVGQNSLEEVNLQSAASQGGENYGWPLMEGTSCFQPSSNCNDGSLTLPILEYSHSPGSNCSITGGYRYRGSEFPQMAGIFFYGDVCSGRIWGGNTDSNGDWVSKILLDTTVGITSFGEDESGEIYLVNYNNGDLLRINQINIPNVSNDVVLNLPTTGVSVLLNDNTSTVSLHADTAEMVAVADIDNNGEDDVIASFLAGSGPGGVGGTYVSRNQGVLTLLDSKTAEQIAVGDLDGNGQDDLLLDFGADGLSLWVNDTGLIPFISLDIGAMAAGDLDNNGQDDMVLSIPGNSTIVFKNLADFEVLDASVASAVSVADVDNNGEDDVIASFLAGSGPGGVGGTYVSRNQGALTLLDSKTAEQIVNGDLDGNGQDDLLLDFGVDGLSLWVNDISLIPLIPLSPVAMVTGDLDVNGQDDIIFSIDGIGTVALKNFSIVDVLDTEVALGLGSGNIDGN